MHKSLYRVESRRRPRESTSSRSPSTRRRPGRRYEVKDEGNKVGNEGEAIKVFREKKNGKQDRNRKVRKRNHKSPRVESLEAVLGAMEPLKDLGLDEMVGMRLQGRSREQLWRRSPRLPRLERASVPSRG